MSGDIETNLTLKWTKAKMLIKTPTVLIGMQQKYSVVFNIYHEIIKLTFYSNISCNEKALISKTYHFNEYPIKVHFYF